jgi:hypothetical protein
MYCCDNASAAYTSTTVLLLLLLLLQLNVLTHIITLPAKL